MNRVFLAITFVAALAACNDRREPLPAPAAKMQTDSAETVELEFLGMLDVGGQFRLSNPTSQAVSFKVTHRDPQGSHARDIRFACQQADSDQWDEGPRPMGDSDAGSLEVPPGGQEMLVVFWEPGLAEHYVRCKADLKLQDNTVVESGEFSW